MADITDHYAARPRYTCLNRACMRMNVWNIGISNQ
jgi:hypothetical protein